MFDAPVGNLLVGGGKGLLLHARHFGLHLGAAAQQVQAGPGEQPGYRVQVRAKGFAADACCLKRNGATAAKAVAHAGRVAKGALAQLVDQF